MKNILTTLLARFSKNLYPTHIIGESYQGGIIFYIDETGLHGLIAGPIDLLPITPNGNPMQSWDNNFPNTQTNAVRDQVYAGLLNTERIIINQGAGDYAAQSCANYQGDSYGDWYLPSKFELNLMYVNIYLAALGGFASYKYWSSTEFDVDNAWTMQFNDGTQDYNSKVNIYSVRPIRAF